MKTHNPGELEFWSCDTDVFQKTVEEEVYEAIKDLLTTNNPDWLLWWFRAESADSETHLHLHVEGRGRPDIVKEFKLSELVTDALDGWGSEEDGISLSYNDRKCIERMQRDFEEQVNRIKKFLSIAR